MKCGNIFLQLIISYSYKVNYELMKEVGINALDKEVVCEMLKKIHRLGYCHGDIGNNIVFDGISTHFIDFDLSGKVDQKYPPLGIMATLRTFPLHHA